MVETINTVLLLRCSSKIRWPELSNIGGTTPEDSTVAPQTRSGRVLQVCTEGVGWTSHLHASPSSLTHRTNCVPPGTMRHDCTVQILYCTTCTPGATMPSCPCRYNVMLLDVVHKNTYQRIDLPSSFIQAKMLPRRKNREISMFLKCVSPFVDYICRL